MDLRKVEKLPQKYKDIVSAYISTAQRLFPKDDLYFMIGDLIKHLCLIYYHLRIDSSILSEQEQDAFFDLLKANNKSFDTYEWKLLYQISGGLSEENGNKSKMRQLIKYMVKKILFAYLK